MEIPIDLIPRIRLDNFDRQVRQLNDEVEDSTNRYHEARGVGDSSQTRLSKLQTILARDTSGLEGSQKAQADLMNFASEGFKKGAEGLMNLTQQSFDVLQTIYKELKKSSPLMEAVESLFQLAMQLFFMPLGNKLAETLIPAVVQLLENVVDMWDELGDGGLAAMFDTAIAKGIEYLADFFTNVGETLEGQGGILTDIGEIFKAVGNFIEHNLLDVIKLILGATTWMVEHLGTMIALIGTFMTLHYTLQLATMAVIASSADSPWGQALGYAAMGVGVAGISASLIAGNLVGYGDGGYIPATPGGKAIIVAEEGEGEFVVPESKKEEFAMAHLPETPKVELPKPKEDLFIETPRVDFPTPRDDIVTETPKVDLRVVEKDDRFDMDRPKDDQQSGDTYYISNNFYGYTTDELEAKVNDVIEDQISRARLRSGF